MKITICFNLTPYGQVDRPTIFSVEPVASIFKVDDFSYSDDERAKFSRNIYIYLPYRAVSSPRRILAVEETLNVIKNILEAFGSQRGSLGVCS
jgi:hypothetical protein